MEVMHTHDPGEDGGTPRRPQASAWRTRLEHPGRRPPIPAAGPRDPGGGIDRARVVGRQRAHGWVRAVFCQQCRLFYRFGSDDETGIDVWVNDDRSRRTDGSKTHAYRVLRRMRASGGPPGVWGHPLSQAMGQWFRAGRALDGHAFV